MKPAQLSLVSCEVNLRPGGSFRFHVINDTHCVSPGCEPYLRGVVEQMKRDEAAFCLHLGDLIVRPVTGTDLIKTTHTGRTAATTVADLLEELE